MMNTTVSNAHTDSNPVLAAIPPRDSDLIYDVGLFDGGDTAYYLFRGYRVVAIDANPLMIDKARARFPEAIRDGRLTLLNLGIAEAPGTATFWVSDVPEWSSFNRAIASRDGTPHRPIEVPVAPFSEVLATYGIPHYLKIDIEGNDSLCVRSLRGGALPEYISVEAECVGDSTVLSGDQPVEMLELLRGVGYRRFKLVNQVGLRAVRTSAMANFGRRIIVSAVHGRLRMPVLSKIAENFTDTARIASMGFELSFGSTGPWGDEVAGSWMTFETARAVYLRERQSFFDRPQPLYGFWHDWHAAY